MSPPFRRQIRWWGYELGCLRESLPFAANSPMYAPVSGIAEARPRFGCSLDIGHLPFFIDNAKCPMLNETRPAAFAFCELT